MIPGQKRFLSWHIDFVSHLLGSLLGSDLNRPNRPPVSNIYIEAIMTQKLKKAFLPRYTSRFVVRQRMFLFRPPTQPNSKRDCTDERGCIVVVTDE